MMDDREPLTPLERRAERAQDSGRSAAAGWLGNLEVAAAMAVLRPGFREIVAPLALDDAGDVLGAVAVIMGFAAVDQHGLESANPFLSWPEERLAPARHIASGIGRSSRRSQQSFELRRWDSTRSPRMPTTETGTASRPTTSI